VLLVDTDTHVQAGKSLGLRPPVGLAEFILDDILFKQVLIGARPNLSLLAGGTVSRP
jgi:hypothetical protein